MRDQQRRRLKKEPGAGEPGFLLVNSTHRPLYVNDEALKILIYPDHQKKEEDVEKLLLEVVQSATPKKRGALSGSAVTWIRSGRRRYACRMISVSPVSDDSHQPVTALMIERNTKPSGLLAMAEKFNLTERECEAVQHLSLGLTSKEISARMGISPNTVKAFLRLVMIKTGVSTRSGIIGKLLKSA